MSVLGLDIGTTTISTVVIEDHTRQIQKTVTLPNPGFLPTPSSWERIQDAEAICDISAKLIERISAEYPLRCVGLSGQMHGVVPLDSDGRAVGPLYTWQDARAAQTDEGVALTDYLTERTGTRVCAGYGLGTLVWNAQKAIHPHAAQAATIGSFLAMRLTGKKSALIHASDAASLGGYDLLNNSFCAEALRLCPILPRVTTDFAWIGDYHGIPVAVSLGDNQASVYGAVGTDRTRAMINLGTGGQVSLIHDEPLSGTFEPRPYVDGLYLLVRCSLCGGRSYALLEEFLRACASLCGVRTEKPLYDAMNRLADETESGGLIVDTRFEGTREEPERRGAITGLSSANFTPACLIRGVLEGMTEELYSGFRDITQHIGRLPSRLIGSGNAIVLNPALQNIISKRFALPMDVPDVQETAAFGAAVYAQSHMD